MNGLCGLSINPYISVVYLCGQSSVCGLLAVFVTFLLRCRSYFSYTYSFPITEEFRQYLYEVIIFLTLSGNACGTIDFIQVLYFD